MRDFDVRVIPNAIDTEAFFPVATDNLRHKLGIATGEQVVLAGCLDLNNGYKNMQALAPLWAKVGRKGRRLVIFGSGGSTLRSQLPDDVIFTGDIRRNTGLRELYSLADVFLSPSLQEAFGKTAAEAAACATPVVAFADTGTADIIRHGRTGYLAEQGSVDGLAQHVDQALNEGGRLSELGRSGRKLCLANFSQPTVAHQYLSLYQELLGTSHLRE